MLHPDTLNGLVNVYSLKNRIQSDGTFMIKFTPDERKDFLKELEDMIEYYIRNIKIEMRMSKDEKLGDW